VIASTTAAVRIGRGRHLGRSRIAAASRALAIGAYAVMLVATAVPNRWPLRPRGYVAPNLALGGGGLGDWRAVLHDPTSAPAVLFVGNIVLYVPFGLFATIGWPRRRVAIVALSALTSALVELAQYQWLGRNATVDDVVLNTLGALMGCVAGTLLVARSSPISRRGSWRRRPSSRGRRRPRRMPPRTTSVPPTSSSDPGRDGSRRR
jgi:VanZ family protein